MYQAIVFLPLLGFILAGIIALVGARGRCPGGEPGHDDHAHDHGTHHAAPSVGGDAGVIHHSAHEHEEHGPSALGSRMAELITTTLLFIAAILSWIGLVQVGFLHHDAHVTLGPYIFSGDLKVDWALRIDTLT